MTRRRWKIVGMVVGVVVLLGLAGGAWFVLRPPPPAEMDQPRAPAWRIDEPGLLANYYPAAGPGQHPGILLLGGSEGGLARDLTRQALLLRAAGYNVLHVAYHNAPGKPAHLARVPIEDFTRGLDWLKARPEVAPAALGIVGYSKGAEAALLVATRYPGVRAVVAGMPSSVTWDGLDIFSILGWSNPSWTEKGKPVPALPYGKFDAAKGMLSVFDGGLAKLAEHQDAIIPVERFRGRLLLVCGGSDQLWPSCPMAERIVARAAENGAPAPVLLRYPDAGHAVMGAPLPATSREMQRFSKLGGTPAANAAARAESWARIVAFLNGVLKQAA